ncbi:unnamed protein product [Rotaria sp. Silwood1]|nr:unnamed protein product [Rotaria sp. Silwood1]CAF1620098.1 unnamed protein product [Rotaria sp. Silwood1]CAF3737082.1 unnamed protein product [Rotaria sp. Silwood1]CAF3762675.1 unnamed protein product [Rotaria sp. Silwood1]CAF3796528.1 unnamed protein product [Rotaria sp. Silwood1]
MLYAALPNKNANVYDILLEELLLYAQKNGILLKPKSILIDFEKASFNAFSKNFPTASIKGCYFHFAQNIWRQIKKKGLVNLSDDDEARRQIANLIMLPLLPPEEINEAFSNIIEELSNIHHKFLKLTDYVHRTYIEEELFPRTFCNFFDLIGIRPKTNNHIEE